MTPLTAHNTPREKHLSPPVYFDIRDAEILKFHGAYQW